jgi:tetratricopeptide (TPR) repeat protein
VRVASFIVASLWLVACRSTSLEVDAGACACVAPPPSLPPPPAAPSRTVRQEPTASSPKVAPLAVCQARGQLPLDAAREAFDARQYEKALSCAAQAAALSPGDVLAHVERANALAQLERHAEAAQAYARALALDPDSLDALAGAAHFYTVLLPSSREVDELGSLYAERGFELATSARDDAFALVFARLSAMAFNDIGQAADALERAEWVLARERADPEALHERALALFELCRFDEARRAFAKLVDDPERGGWAHHHLGLLLERQGKQADADAHFLKARAIDPEAFPPPVLLEPAAFRAELARALAELPEDMKRDLRGIPVEMEDLPAEVDLVSGEPPLSPNILGLFRGTPLGQPCEPEPDAKPGEPCRSIVVYRKNLARAVKTEAELKEQLRVTLLHEIGHLRGEDDSELAARGLE